MKRLAWLTDPHLNFVTSQGFDDLVTEIQETHADGLLISGDIGEAETFAGYLKELAAKCALPIYFVLGNHDYYRGSISQVRSRARLLTRENENLHWLPASGVVPVTETTCLLGHGGWGDARYGDFLNSDILINDYVLIQELHEVNLTPGRPIELSPETILNELLQDKLHALGDEAARVIQQGLEQVPESCTQLIVLTHVPPFREACWYDGRLSDDNWVPHFSCMGVGNVLRAYMQCHPEQSMLVLCGHTHGAGESQISENLRVLTGGSTYGEPHVQRVLDLDLSDVILSEN